MKIRRSSILKLYLFPVLTCFLLAIFLLTFSVNVSASGGSSTTYFPMYQDDNNKFSSLYLPQIESIFDFDNNYVFARYGFYDAPFVYFYVAYVPKDQDTLLYGELNNNGYQFSLYRIGGATVYYRYINFLTDGTLGGVFEASAYDFQNLNSSLYDSNCSYISNYNVYTNNSNNQGLVLFYENTIPDDWFPTTGHSHAPENLNIPVGTNLPTTPTGPRIWSRYTWTHYVRPQTDFSTVTNAIESIGDILTYSYTYLKDNINGDLSNLGDNIVGSIESVVKNIQYYGNNIANNLVSFITNFYQNMTSLLEPITVPFLCMVALGTDPETGFFSIPYLTKTLFLPDVSSLELLLVEHDEFDFISTTVALFSTAPATIRSLIQVTPSATIHVPSCIYHGQQIGDFDISFSWFNQYKLYYDVLINGFLIIGYLYWLFISFGSHLRGMFLNVQPEDDFKVPIGFH